jgi:hypothetical protein
LTVKPHPSATASEGWYDEFDPEVGQES